MIATPLKMKKAGVLAVSALIAIAFASRTSIQWTEKCSKEFNISKEMFDNFDPLVSEWDERLKCYTRCELIERRVLDDDPYNHTAFNRPFSRTVGSRLRFENNYPAIKAGADVIADCMVTNTTTLEGCEKAYSFAKCIAGTIVTAEFLEEFIAEHT